MPKKPTRKELEQMVKDLEKEFAKNSQAEDKLEHLNRVLLALHNVNSLIVREKDRNRLLQGLCDNLIENRGYYNAWIALMDESGAVTDSAEAGLGKEFLPMIHKMERGEMTECVRQALYQPQVVRIEDPFSSCTECPLSKKYSGRGAMTVRLRHGQKIYGVLSVSVPRTFILDEQEHSLLEELAGDIAFGLYRIELEQQQYESQKALIEGDKKLSQIIHGSSIPTFVIDNNHIITHWNKACENLTGISSKEMVGTTKQWRAFYPEERPVMADLVLDNTPARGLSRFYRGEYRKSDVILGGYEAEDFFPNLGEGGKWLFFTAAPLKDSEGKVSGAIETLQDITERKMSAEAMERSLHKLGKRVKELNCLFAISSMVERRGISQEEILRGTVDLIPPAWQYSEITCARITLEGREFKTQNFKETIWKQARDIIVHDKAAGILEVCYLEEKPECDEGPFLNEERALIDAIAERLGRIMERNQAQTALRKSEQRFRNLVEHSLIGISIVQEDRIVYQNPEQERLFGPLPRKSKLTDIESIHPEDVEKVRQFHDKILSKAVQTLDTEFRFYPKDKKGNRLDMKWVYCRTSLIEYQGKEAMLINMMDITRVKELEHLLRIQDKMTSLGRVAAGIAHEIRNPLSGINIYLNALEKIYDKAESMGKVKGILEQIQSASQKIESVIRRVMDFSKPSTPKFVKTDLNQPIEAAIELCRVSLRKSGIEFEKDLAHDLPPCDIDPNLIEQVILNLITNASEAIKKVDGTKKIGVTSSQKKNHIVVMISDSGPGVPSNIRDKIFDPYYTTKSESTGIGLSICQRIIIDHSGSLEISKSKWGGAKFTVSIPLKKRLGKR